MILRTLPLPVSVPVPLPLPFPAAAPSACVRPQVGHPFDLVKVRLQTEGKAGRFRGPVHCVVESVRSEGLMSLYKGVTPPLLGTGVINALVFGMQGVFVAKVKEIEGTPAVAAASVAQTAKAAVLTGVFISFVVTVSERQAGPRPALRRHPCRAIPTARLLAHCVCLRCLVLMRYLLDSAHRGH